MSYDDAAINIFKVENDHEINVVENDNFRCEGTILLGGGWVPVLSSHRLKGWGGEIELFLSKM